ncbi:MAG: hypothetical protein JWQ68_1820 [Cryobacterium sp.]|nr:hypothetical protein [Cryobacterium sp.]
MPEEAEAPDTDPEIPPSVRAQLLATEHWSLLASRSTTQSEVLTRISIFLTLTSAGLVSLALLGQVTRFEGDFPVFALTVLGFVILVGILTQVRVTNVGMEDLQYVLAMNRLRGAYVDLDPQVAKYLMASRFDDFHGSRDTYYYLGKRGSASVLGGSSMILIMAVNTALVGIFGTNLVGALGAVTPWPPVVGITAAFTYCAISFWLGAKAYVGLWKTYQPLFPSPEGERSG